LENVLNYLGVQSWWNDVGDYGCETGPNRFQKVNDSEICGENKVVNTLLINVEWNVVGLMLLEH
jgi:hypothetical protein